MFGFCFTEHRTPKTEHLPYTIHTPYEFGGTFLHTHGFKERNTGSLCRDSKEEYLSCLSEHFSSDLYEITTLYWNLYFIAGLSIISVRCSVIVRYLVFGSVFKFTELFGVRFGVKNRCSVAL